MTEEKSETPKEKRKRSYTTQHQKQLALVEAEKLRLEAGDNKNEPHVERALIGWENIAKMFNTDKQTFAMRYRQELMEAGVVFKQKMNVGGPWAQTIYCAFPSMLMRWAGLKAKRGEVI